MNDNEFIKIRDEFLEEIASKAVKIGIDNWNYSTNINEENMKKLKKSMEDFSRSCQNEELYNKLKEVEKSGLEDKHLAKQLKILTKIAGGKLNDSNFNQALCEKEFEIASKFDKYVPQIDGKETTDAEINKIILTEKNIDLRKKAYEAIVKRGDLISEDLINLVKMRNEYAKSQGYKNFFDYMLDNTYNFDANHLQNLLDDIYYKTKEINKKVQTEYKKELAKEYGIGVEDLREYHYGLLVNNNSEKEINKYLKTKEQVVEICKKAYLGMGYDIDNMPIMLDLFPRKNKNAHSFCFEIDAGKDARILANLTNTTESIRTLCHELGHGIYHLGISRDLLYLERSAYPAINEAVAMMMADLPKRENILKGIVSDETLDKYKKDLKKSEAKSVNNNIFYVTFEKAMYENPYQNLQLLWHNLRVKYVAINDYDKLDNKWATVPHFLSNPVYYQNYFRAQLIKAQIYKHLHKELGNITENKNTAVYLNHNLFKYGTSLEENDLIKKFTGESLSSKALCDIFI